MISQFPLNQSQAHATALISSFSHREPALRRESTSERAREGPNERIEEIRGKMVSEGEIVNHLALDELG